MRFHIRQPDGTFTPVTLNFWLVLGSVLIGLTVVVFALLSACSEYQSSNQTATSNGGNPGSVSFITFCCEWPRGNPNEKANESEDSMGMLVFTGIIAVGTLGIWLVYLQMRDHNVATERPYVALNIVFRRRPIGSVFVGNPAATMMGDEPIPIRLTPGGDTYEIPLLVALTNFGNTPATITDVVVSPHVGRPAELPERPPYDRTKMRPDTPSHAFLVKNGEATFNLTVILERWAPDDDERLWILGYVKYVDKFNRRHKAGFARLCELADLPTHIQGVRFEMREHYNYDD